MKKALPVLAAVALIFFIFTLEATKSFFSWVWEGVYPVFIGIVFALLLNAPVSVLEKTILKSPKIAKFRRILSLLITFVGAAGITALLVWLIVPEIRSNFERLTQSVENFNSNGFSSVFGGGAFASQLDGILEKLVGFLPKALPAAGDLIQKTVKIIISVFLGFMLGILAVMRKEKLYNDFFRLFKHIFGTEKARLIAGGLSVGGDKFSRFLGGQLIEALIFGAVCYVVFAICKFPYAALVALALALGNLIPTLGAYIGGGIGFVMILTVSPKQAFIFLAVAIVLQQIEQVTTYPVIVGKYVGLSPFWMLFAVVVGGGLFGFWGLLLSVPVVAFFDNLIRVMIDKKEKERLAAESPPAGESPTISP